MQTVLWLILLELTYIMKPDFFEKYSAECDKENYQEQMEVGIVICNN